MRPLFALAVAALTSGYKWGGSGITVTFSFLTNIPGYYSLNADALDEAREILGGIKPSRRLPVRAAACCD